MLPQVALILPIPKYFPENSWSAREDDCLRSSVLLMTHLSISPMFYSIGLFTVGAKMVVLKSVDEFG